MRSKQYNTIQHNTTGTTKKRSPQETGFRLQPGPLDNMSSHNWATRAIFYTSSLVNLNSAHTGLELILSKPTSPIHVINHTSFFLFSHLLQNPLFDCNSSDLHLQAPHLLCYQLHPLNLDGSAVRKEKIENYKQQHSCTVNPPVYMYTCTLTP